MGGNHEDYKYLRNCVERAGGNGVPLVPVETSGRIMWLPPGHVYEPNGIRITGISGIDAANCGRNPENYDSAAVINENDILDWTLEIWKSCAESDIDILLTHDGLPNAAKPGKGTFTLLNPIDALNPRYHFFGHYHTIVDPISYADWLTNLAQGNPQVKERCSEPGRVRTTGVHINKLAFARNDDRLRQHVMGLLEVDDANDYRFEFVEDAWLSGIDRQTMWHVRGRH